MAFRKARSKIIAAPQAGTYSHEARDALRERNLLAVGDVSAEFVIELLKRAGGADHRESPHHRDAQTTVHIFSCRHAGERWYVKAYFIDDEARFISVHPSRRTRT
jgi:hypothetical protein